MNKQMGLSLIELMIAITLGIILMTGVVQVFISSKTVYSSQQAMSRVQETGRLAIEFLSRDTRMAGYMGCASRMAEMELVNTLNDRDTYPFDYLTPLKGFTAAALPVNHGLAPAPRQNTDFLVLRSAFGAGVAVTQNNTGIQVFISNEGAVNNGCTDGTARISDICRGDILVITDCSKARVFQASSITAAGAEAVIDHVAAGTPGNLIPIWGGEVEDVFKPGAEVLKATNTTYFIADGVSGRPSLWQNINGVNMELLEGVDDMSLTYGVDTNGDNVPDNYLLAGVVGSANWNKVVSVRVELLVSSIEDGVVPETQSYSFEGEDDVMPNPEDKRLRQVFTTTIAVRSRSF